MSALRHDEADDCDFDPIFAAKHGISEEVWRSRGYRKADRENLAPIHEEFAKASPRQLRDVLRKTRDQAQWIIRRHLPPDMVLKPIFPETRPDDLVRTGGPTKHQHGGQRFPRRRDCPNHLDKWCPNCVSTSIDPAKAEDHIKRGGQSRGRAKKCLDPDCPCHLRHNGRRYVFHKDEPHHGGNIDWPHYHLKEGKYQHVLNEWVWRIRNHDHSWYTTRKELRALDNHVKRPLSDGHGGTAPPPGLHSHEYRERDRENGNASRLDVHPLAAPRLTWAKTVFFGIEGCIKADAMLMYILKHRLDATVFSVPSIGNWAAGKGARELADFATLFLLNKVVYIVADADAYENDGVMEQARLCRVFLLRLGVRAHIALPPRYTRRQHKGVDDYLAGYDTVRRLFKTPGRLEFLEVNDREPREAQRDFINECRVRSDKSDTIAVVLYGLSMISGPEGINQASERSHARALRIPHERFRRGLEYIKEADPTAIEKEGDFNIARKRYLTKLYELREEEYYAERDKNVEIFLAAMSRWAKLPPVERAMTPKPVRQPSENPKIIIREDLRAWDLPARRLGPIPKCDIGGKSLNFQGLTNSGKQFITEEVSTQ